MNHMEFMGVPFEGTAKTFFSKLKSSAKIYSVEKESDEEVICLFLLQENGHLSKFTEILSVLFPLSFIMGME